MKIMNCASCGCEFAHHRKKKHCSDKCRIAYVNNNIKIKRRRSNKSAAVECAECNIKFCIAPTTQGRPVTKYCSEDCQKKSLKAIRKNTRKPYQKVDYPEKSCAKCGVVFKPNTKRGDYCSRECRRSVSTNRERGPYRCVGCGSEYTTRRPVGEGEKYCSKQCANKHLGPIRKGGRKSKSCRLPEYTAITYCEICNKPTKSAAKGTTCSDTCLMVKHMRIRQRKIATIECVRCGVKFSRLYGTRSTVCGSTDCKSPTKRLGKNHRDRARRYGCDYESFDVMAVLERDNWTCQLCGDSTPSELRGTMEDNAPEVDHIIPLSNGGAHSMDNTQCACRACNIFKGTMSNNAYIQWNQGDRGGSSSSRLATLHRRLSTKILTTTDPKINFRKIPYETTR